MVPLIQKQAARDRVEYASLVPMNAYAQCFGIYVDSWNGIRDFGILLLQLLLLLPCLPE